MNNQCPDSLRQLAVLLLSLLPLAVQSEPVSQVEWRPAARIIDFGIYLTSVDERVPAPDTTTGEISLLREPTLVQNTTRIPAIPKTSFGLRYQLDGIPVGEALAVTDVVITPGIHEPGSDNAPAYRQSWRDVVVAGKPRYTGYTFDYAWEAVPGPWRIEIWYGDSMLLAQDFQVVKSHHLQR